MSAVREGSMLANEGQRLTSKMRDGIVTGVSDEQGAQGGAKAVQLPRRFDARDSYDDMMNQRMQLMDKDGMTPFGQVYYDDKVGRWLQKKADAVEAANMDAWFNKEFNKNNLADRQFAQQINPKFYEERERLLRERTEEVLNLKMIQLRGPRTKEDLYKLWLINTGRVQLPADWDRIGADPSGGEGINDDMRANFREGLIRLPKFWTQNQRRSNARELGARGLWGNEAAARNQFRMGVANAKNAPLSQAPGTLAESFLNSNLTFPQ